MNKTYRIFYEEDYATIYEDDDGMGYEYEEAKYLARKYNEEQEEKNAQSRSS